MGAAKPMKKPWQENRKYAWPILLLILFLLILDIFPRHSKLHGKLRDSLSFLYNGMGIWQPQWTLFAPDVETAGVLFDAAIEYDNHSVVIWRSPNPSIMGLHQKTLQFRHTNFFYRSSSQPWLNGNLINWLKREYHRSDARIIKVTLRRTVRWIDKSFKPAYGEKPPLKSNETVEVYE